LEWWAVVWAEAGAVLMSVWKLTAGEVQINDGALD